MIWRDPAISKRGAGLADGLKTVAPDAGGLPRGGTTGKAQSEREKRGPRHSDDGVESSSQRSGDGHSTGSVQGGGPAPASKIASGIGTSFGGRKTPGLVVLCPNSNPFQPANHCTVQDVEDDQHHSVEPGMKAANDGESQAKGVAA